MKFGAGNNGNWVTVNTYPASSIFGTTIGTGAFQGIDWKVKGLLPEMGPGKYLCTVIITMIAGG